MIRRYEDNLPDLRSYSEIVSGSICGLRKREEQKCSRAINEKAFAEAEKTINGFMFYDVPSMPISGLRDFLLSYLGEDNKKND